MTQHNPLISVIIPAYNVENYLDECIKSVVSQTYQNLEIILVDDGSPDRCGEMCDNWATKDSRIKVIHKQNQGLGYARNSGIDIATGDYIAFIDSDDYIDTNMYETLISKAIDTDSDIVYCGFNKELSDGSFKDVIDFNEERIFEKDELINLSLAYIYNKNNISSSKLTMSVWHSIYKRSVINTQFYSERKIVSEDLHFQISAIHNSNRICFIPKCLYHYRYNGNSLSRSFKFDKFAKYIELRNIINLVYEKYNLKHIADYLVLLLAYTIIRSMNLCNIPIKQRYKYTHEIVFNPVWSDIVIRDENMSKSERLIYKLIKSKSTIFLFVLSETYYFFRKFKGKY